MESSQLLECCTEALHSCVGDLARSYEEVSTAVLVMTLTLEVESESVESSQLLECCTEALHSCVSDLVAAMKK